MSGTPSSVRGLIALDSNNSILIPLWWVVTLCVVLLTACSSSQPIPNDDAGPFDAPVDSQTEIEELLQRAVDAANLGREVYQRYCECDFPCHEAMPLTTESARCFLSLADGNLELFDAYFTAVMEYSMCQLDTFERMGCVLPTMCQAHEILNPPPDFITQGYQECF